MNPVEKSAGILQRVGGRYQAVVILNGQQFLADATRNSLGEARDDLRSLKKRLQYDLICGKEKPAE